MHANPLLRQSCSRFSLSEQQTDVVELAGDELLHDGMTVEGEVGRVASLPKGRLELLRSPGKPHAIRAGALPGLDDAGVPELLRETPDVVEISRKVGSGGLQSGRARGVAARPLVVGLEKGLRSNER
jgi:hypothetical protein